MVDEKSGKRMEAAVNQQAKRLPVLMQ